MEVAHGVLLRAEVRRVHARKLRRFLVVGDDNVDIAIHVVGQGFCRRRVEYGRHAERTRFPQRVDYDIKRYLRLAQQRVGRVRMFQSLVDVGLAQSVVSAAVDERARILWRRRRERHARSALDLPYERRVHAVFGKLGHKLFAYAVVAHSADKPYGGLVAVVALGELGDSHRLERALAAEPRDTALSRDALVLFGYALDLERHIVINTAEDVYHRTPPPSSPAIRRPPPSGPAMCPWT